MGATEEQIQVLSDLHVTHVSYVLILYSLAFLVYLFANMLLHLYAVNAMPATPPKDVEAPRVNGSTMPNGHPRGAGLANDRMARDAEEFELEGLIDDDGDDEPDTPGAKEGRRHP